MPGARVSREAAQRTKQYRRQQTTTYAGELVRVVPKLARQRVLQPSRQLEYGLPHASIFRRKDSTKTVRARSSRPAVQHRPPRPVVVEHGIVKIRDAVVGAGSRIMPGGKADDNDDKKDNQRNRQ
jgi:hypothetical protein